MVLVGRPHHLLEVAGHVRRVVGTGLPPPLTLGMLQGQKVTEAGQGRGGLVAEQGDALEEQDGALEKKRGCNV